MMDTLAPETKLSAQLRSARADKCATAELQYVDLLARADDPRRGDDQRLVDLLDVLGISEESYNADAAALVEMHKITQRLSEIPAEAEAAKNHQNDVVVTVLKEQAKSLHNLIDEIGRKGEFISFIKALTLTFGRTVSPGNSIISQYETPLPLDEWNERMQDAMSADFDSIAMRQRMKLASLQKENPRAAAAFNAATVEATGA
jgi:hypothetical protein